MFRLRRKGRETADQRVDRVAAERARELAPQRQSIGEPTHWRYRYSLQRVDTSRVEWTVEAVPFYGQREGTALPVAAGWSFGRKDAVSMAKSAVRADRLTNKRREKKEWVTL